MAQNKKDTTFFIFKISLALCLVCATLVSIAAVALKPKQDENTAKEKMRNILQAAGIYDPNVELTELYKQITPVAINLESGQTTDTIDANSFDFQKAAKNPATSVALAQGEDIASIKRIPTDVAIYELKDADGKVSKLILPVNGYGLWSTMYGFLALNTSDYSVAGLTFYDQKETAGLGGEVANPAWQAGWVGKTVFAADGSPQIQVVKSGVSPDPEVAKHQVDGIAGATLTSVGVQNMMHFWLSKQGYKPFLDNFKQTNQ